MARALKAGVIGVGMVGGPHIDAIGRTGLAEVAAVAASSEDSARRAADRYGVPVAEADWRAVVEDPGIDVIHNCTPNHLHEQVGTAALAAGKHLITEKPLAATTAGAARLVKAAADSSQLCALCHNYRFYAMVAEARELIRAGEIGEVHQVHGAYLQDWLSDAGASNWRLDPELGGPSTTFADIGTHWCDLAMHLLGRPIESLCAVTGSSYGRTGDDHTGALLRFAGGALGTLVASQASPGAKNSLRIRLDGDRGSLSWDQERPEELWIGRLHGPAELRRKAPDELSQPARALVHLPAGHTEGWDMTFVNLFSACYRRILDRALPGDERVATLSEGLTLMQVTGAVVSSSSERRWVDLPVA